ncbi:exosortase/archaeosortase family protein [Desulfosarcina sp. OttesenSCG-928-G10]|nr:exosortase/archaeosortase family protein [Desulfosarcina sp. OttesenSCG-928-G10]MDL2321197.1 exosortase/archaeosortase family protein [Desulfosarcina sp. OttesenSCG-928-B08]
MTFAETLKKYPWAWLLVAGLLAIIYEPIFPRMVSQWEADPNYSHGFLVPFISAWFAWKIWPELRKMPVKPSNWGIAWILFGLLLLAFGWTVHELFTTRSSLIFIFAGLIHTMFGSRVLKCLSLPVAFLIFMIPLPYTLYDALALPLRSLVSWLATEAMHICGILVLREGNVIILPNITLEVVEACSGMRSLVSLMALGTTYAFLTLEGMWRKIVLIITTIPIAVITNAVRIFVTGILSRHFGSVAAEGFFHDFAGFSVFAVALVLTAVTGWLLSKVPGPAKEEGCAHAD